MRKSFFHKNQKIYEWDQGLEEINIYIKPPEYVLPKNKQKIIDEYNEIPPKLEVKIQYNKIYVGIQGNPPFLDNLLSRICKVNESTWTIDNEELQITLQKMLKAEVWPSVFQGHEENNPQADEEMKQKILLERFQEEHQGFDFSQAKFNGMVPDPRKFLNDLQ